jgi:hypothetical protein
MRSSAPPGRTIARARVSALLFLLLALGTASAQQPRPVPIPDNAVYGELKAFRYPEAKIGERVLRLSPGARVYDTRNLIIMPASMPPKASVRYRLDIQGQISQMWLLTKAEAAAAQARVKPKPKPEPPKPEDPKAKPEDPNAKPKEGGR